MKCNAEFQIVLTLKYLIILTTKKAELKNKNHILVFKLSFFHPFFFIFVEIKIF